MSELIGTGFSFRLLSEFLTLSFRGFPGGFSGASFLSFCVLFFWGAGAGLFIYRVTKVASTNAMHAKRLLQKELGKKLDVAGNHSKGPILQPPDLDRFTSAHLDVIRSTFQLCCHIVRHVAEAREVSKLETTLMSSHWRSAGIKFAVEMNFRELETHVTIE